MMNFSRIADDCARATNRQQLDKPAKEFGAFLGNLSKDGVLALVGLAGGMTAPRVMPQVEEVLTNKVGNVKQILNQGVPKLEEPRLATPNGAPAETTNIKPTGKTALENSEPLEMTSSEYKDLRGKTPSKEIRDAVNPNGPKIDPIYKYYVERLEADHIVSMKEITEMPGFENLSKAQQVEVLNLRDNFLGLGKATNASKGAKTWAEWAGHKEMGKIPTDVRLRMLEIEKQARIEVQKAIDVRLQKK